MAPSLILSCSADHICLHRICSFLASSFGNHGIFVIVICIINLPSLWLMFSLGIPTPVRVEHMVRWIPPLVGEFKLNSDVALDHLHGRTGLGAMLRNHCGEVLLSDLVSFDGILKPDVAEAKPVLFGVSMALEGGFTSFSIKSDAASIIKAF
ncbi:hypothetical protein ACOSQ2_004473 [Xanthoceras sorbifolium]